MSPEVESAGRKVDEATAPAPVRNLGWQGLSTLTVQVLQAGVTLYVASRVSPEAFALVGIASVLFNLQFMVREALGLGQAVIYRDDGADLRDAVDASFVVTAGMGALLAGLTFAGAPVLARLFIEGFVTEDVIGVVRLMSLFLLFIAVSHIPQSVVERFHSFRNRAIVEMTSVGLYAAAALILLAEGFGVWSIILARPLQGATLALGFWIAAPVRPRFPPRMNLQVLRPLLSYGKFLGGVSVLGFAISSLDNVIIGSLAGSAALGGYALAYTITNAAPTLVVQTVNKVFFPLFSRLRTNGKAVGEAFAEALHWAAVGVLPATLALVTVVPDAMIALFGSEWRAAVAFLPILAIYGLARTVGSVSNALLAGVGRPEVTFHSTAIAVGLPLLLVWPMSGRGGLGIAAAFTLGQVVSAGYSLAHTRSSWVSRMPARLVAPGGVSLLCLGLAVSVGYVLPSGGSTSVGELVVFCAAYPLLLWALDHRFRSSIGGVLTGEGAPVRSDSADSKSPERDAGVNAAAPLEGSPEADEMDVLRVCYFGFYNPEYPRNSVLRRGLSAQDGIEVIECTVPSWLDPGHARGEGPSGYGASRLAYEASELARAALRTLSLAWQLVRLSGRVDAVVVAEFNQGAVPLARLFTTLMGIPLIVDFLISLYDEGVLYRQELAPGRPRARYRYLIDRLSVRFADRLLVDCHPQSEYFEELFPGASESSFVLPIGVPEWQFPPSPIPLRSPSDPVRVLFFGHFQPLHGVPTIVEAAELLKGDGRFRFRLIGWGSLFDELREEVEGRSVPVTFEDRIPFSRLRERIADSHVCLGVFGDAKRARLVVPNKVWQCLASGRPVVSVDGPGPRSLLKNGTHCLLVPSTDPKALAAALGRLADCPEWASELAEQGSSLVRARYSSEPLGEKLADLVRSLDGRTREGWA